MLKFKSGHRRNCLAFVVAAVILISPFTVPLSLLITSSSAESWKTGWLYSKLITIDHRQVGADSVNFPILINITDHDLAINAQSDGDDICFLDTLGIQLSHEIELYSAGHLVAWVEVPSLSSSADTMFYMYYGNAVAGNQEDPHGVWDSNFMMVQHLSETSSTHYDSTVNGNSGSPMNGVVQGAAGKIDGADDFDGTNDYVTIPHSSTITGFTQAFTASFWTRMDSINGRRVFLNKWNTNSQRAWYVDYDSTRGTNTLGLFVSADGSAYSYWYAAFTPVVGNWYHIAVVWRSGQQPAFYVDGEAVDVTTSNVRPSIYDNSQEPLYIGRSYVGGRFFDGVIDEVRISNVARSAQWIQTCYNNEVNPSHFYTIGSVIFEPKAPKVSDPYPYDDEMNVSISLSELSITVSDSNGDLMNITGATDPDIGSSEGLNIPDTPFTIPVSGLNYGTTYTWYVSVTDGTFWTNMTCHFTTESKPILKYKALTVDHSLVAGNLVNFPILIDIIDNDLARDAQPDGSDIYFTDNNGSQISHEIELYSAGHLVAWVKVPSLSSAANTTLYMCYGVPGAGEPENPAGVWDSNFMMVQHLSETSGTHYDSTANGNNGSPMNGVNQTVAGKIDGADDFDGANDYIVVPHSGTITGFTQAFAASFWIKMDTITGRRTLLNKWNTANNQRAWYIDYDSSRGTNTLGLFISADGSAYSYWYAAFSPVAGNWYHISVVWQSRQQPLFYVNGALATTTSTPARASIYNNQLESLYVGGSYTTSRYFDGVIDEVRISNVARSAQWIQTSYNNQINPSAFIRKEPDLPTVVSHIPEADETDVPLTTTVQVTFSEAMDHAAAEAAFSISPSISGSNFSWSSDDAVLTCSPSSNLASNTTYAVTITAAARDKEGENMLESCSWNFTTVSTPPFVISVVPGVNATNVAIGTTVQVTFSEAMDHASAENSFSISPSVGSELPYFAWGSGDTKMNATLTSTLAYTTNYTVTISIVAMDKEDQRMSSPYSWSFTTQYPSPPYVVLPTLPASGEMNVSYTIWGIKFNEPMNENLTEAALSVNTTSTMKFNWINGSYVNFYIAPLNSFTGYSVVISTAARDAQGENTATPYTWSFRTGDFSNPAFSLKWTYNTQSLGTGESSPLIGDLTSSAGEEVVYAGGDTGSNSGAVVCLSGTTGRQIWRYTDVSIGWNVQPQMGDINNDGKLEIVVPLYYPTGILVLKADGTLYWKRTGIGGSSYTSKPLIVDPDGDGLWMIFASPEDVLGFSKYTEWDKNGDGVIQSTERYNNTYTSRIWAFNYDGREMKNGLWGTAGGSRSATGGANAAPSSARYQWFSWRPCSGGFSMADTDNDGVFELYQNDRDMYFGDGGFGKGTIAWEWNATSQSLQLKWYQPDMLVSSHAPILVDVNKDGVLDVVAAYMRGGMAVFNSTTGAEIRKDYNLGLPSHYQPVVYDIDRDGNPEILLADGDHPGNSPPDIVVFDLTRWRIDARMYVGPCKFPPTVGEVTGDGIMDIIAVSDTGIYVFDGSHNPAVDKTYPVQVVATGLWYQCMYAVVQDIDNDLKNEIVVTSSGYRVYAYDTPAPRTTPRPRSEVQYYNERRTGVAEYVPPVFYDRTAPILSDATPSSRATNVPVSLSYLSFSVKDLQGDLMNYTVTANFPVDSADLIGTNMGTGTYTVDVTAALEYHRRYTWRVSVTDGVHTNKQAYTFITLDGTPPGQPPTQSPPILQSSGVGVYQNATSYDLTCSNRTTYDPDGDKLTNIYRWLRNGQSIANLIMPFDTDSLTAAKDYSGYNNNGNIYGATWTSSGKVGGAYSFDGVDDYIKISDGGAGYYNGRIYSSNLGGQGNWNEMTVEMWINLAALSTKESTRLLMKIPSYEIGLGSITRSGYASNRLTAAVWLDNPASGDNNGPPDSRPKATEYWSVTAPSNMLLNLNTWYHVAFTYKDGGGTSNSALTLYINGVAVDEKTSRTTRGTIKASSGEPLFVGWYDYFRGMIDEVRIYSRALSAEQISQRYNETKSGVTSSSTIVDTETKTGETWTCQVTPNDGHQDGTAITSNPVSILPGPQIPPVVSNVQVWGNASLSTSRVGSDEKVLAIYIYFDENDDPEVIGGSFGTQIWWYRNGTHVPAFDNLTSLSPNLTAAHEDWTFQIKPGDGHALAAEWYKATNKVIVNSLPEVTDHSPEYGATLNYLSLSVNETQTFSLTCTEMDGDPVTIQWQVDGVNAADPVFAFTYPATTSFTWTVPAIGSYTVRARIYDTGYGSSYTTQSWNIVVRS